LLGYDPRVGAFRPEDLLDGAREGLAQVERALRMARRRRPADPERIRRCEAAVARLRSAVSGLEAMCRAQEPSGRRSTPRSRGGARAS
jgi:hypothetical protein